MRLCFLEYSIQKQWRIFGGINNGICRSKGISGIGGECSRIMWGPLFPRNKLISRCGGCGDRYCGILGCIRLGVCTVGRTLVGLHLYGSARMICCVRNIENLQLDLIFRRRNSFKHSIQILVFACSKLIVCIGGNRCASGSLSPFDEFISRCRIGI